MYLQVHDHLHDQQKIRLNRSRAVLSYVNSMHLGRGGISSALLRFPSRAIILLVIILNPNLLTV
jgi:hypothetical protein